MKKNVHVIQHTHWDFEWYFTSNESLVQLTYHMDEVFDALERGILDYYLLDGQLSIVEDYLEVVPEHRERFGALVKAGKLFIGPWYTQTDELIISGESIIRNLAIGIETADALGGVMRIGYLPDSFGQGKDMPKIYNGMDIQRTVFWRGVPNDKATQREFIWKSEDGSKVTALNIKNGYFVGGGLIYSDDATGLLETVEKDTTLPDIALPVGGDQRYVDYNLKERIDFYEKKLAGTGRTFVESHYPALFDEIEKSEVDLPVVEGEFISSSVSKIHRSIYSSRYDHKYMNDKIERRMIYQVEPLMTMADQLGISYKKALVDKVWKLLLRNHAHDSAGGCNSDKTNRIINNRFVEADQISYSIIDYLTRKISESREVVAPNDLLFFNTLPYKCKKQVQVQVSTKQKSFKLWLDGKEVLYQLNTQKAQYNGSIRRDESTYKKEDYYYISDLTVELTLPALDYLQLELEEIGATEASIIPVQKANKIENVYYELELKQGQCNLLNKKTDEALVNFLWVEDSGDEGDTYDYSPAHQDDHYQLDFSEAEVTVQKGPLKETMTLQGTWAIAKDLTARSQELRNQEIPYTLTITLAKNSKQVALHLLIDNQSDDHRMRLVVETGIAAQTSIADTPFGFAERPVVDPHLHEWEALGWREEPTAIFPMLHCVNLHQADKSVTLFSKGIKEYQIVGDDFSQIALTLFRSVGFLGRPDLIRRPGIASGNEFQYVPTPDSQLQQTLRFKVAIQLDSLFEPAQVMKDFQQYAISVPFYQIQELNRFTTTLKYFVSNPLRQAVTANELLDISDLNAVVFSSFNRSRNGEWLILRLYNPATNPVEAGVLNFPKEATVGFTNLEEHLLTTPSIQSAFALGTFKPGEIKTIAFRY
ncbi:glycoside hydrolase family 38 N-terminal domain-containing protein [Isobaculum melis]|nr:glycoside hydrolase family 38 C-terminal domain-containing protein [Isobaculum melis]